MASRTRERAQGPRPEATEEQSRAVVVFDAKAKGQQLVSALEERRPQIEAFLAADPETTSRFLTVAIDAITRDRNLLEADLFSLVASVRHAAIMGLEPTSVMGEGAIVVYRDSGQGGKKIAQFQPMVRGLAKLARNSGQVKAIGVDVVKANDLFDYRSGSDPAVEHKPWIDGLHPWSDATDPGDVIGAYAYVRLVSGELVAMFMSTPEITKRRNVSKSWKSSGERSIWGQWPEEMMKKTVLRRLLVEKVPLSFRAQRALALDAEIDSPDGEPEKVEAVPNRTVARLTAHVDEDASQAAQNGSGAAEEVEGVSTPVDVVADHPDGETVDENVCGKAGPKSDAQRCVRSKHGAEVMHKDADGESWI